MEVNTILLCDAVVPINNKLYIIGGGYDTVYTPGFPTLHNLSAVCIIMVQWEELGKPHRCIIDVVTVDGYTISRLFDNVINIGKDVVPAGYGSNFQIAVSNQMVTFNSPGDFVISVTVDDEEIKRLRFSVKQMAMALG